MYRNYSCISHTFLYQFHTQKLGVRLIFEVQIFSGLITNCNHKLSSRWSHINAATSGMGGSVWESDDEELFKWWLCDTLWWTITSVLPIYNYVYIDEE